RVAPLSAVLKNCLQHAVAARAHELEGVLAVVEAELVRDEPLRLDAGDRPPRELEPAARAPAARKSRRDAADLARDERDAPAMEMAAQLECGRARAVPRGDDDARIEAGELDRLVQRRRIARQLD